MFRSFVQTFRELVKNNLPILLALFSLYFATLLKILSANAFVPFGYKPSQIAKAMPAFFALSKGKIALQNLGSLFIANSLKLLKFNPFLIRITGSNYFFDKLHTSHTVFHRWKIIINRLDFFAS